MKWLAFLLCLGGSTMAAADIIHVEFAVAPGSWQNNQANPPPFGLSSQPAISGSMDLDTTKSDKSAFVGLDYATGSKVWTLADISNSSFVDYSIYNLGYSSAPYFNLYLNSPSINGNSVSQNNSISISEGYRTIFCNYCVSSRVTAMPAAVPEPTSWLMLTAGFALVGATIRRHSRWIASARPDRRPMLSAA